MRLSGSFTFVSFGWIAALAASTALAEGGDAEATPDPVQGIDVSHYSGTVDWPTLAAAGYDFAYVKATEGVDSGDPTFAANWAGAGAAGLPRGAYHFYVSEDDPEEQARFFLATARPQPCDLVPAVDVEVIGHGTQPGLPDRLQTFLDLVEAAVGVKPMIYTGPKFWDANLTGDFGEHPLWIAEYDVSAPTMPTGWETWTLWQYEDTGGLPGVEKDADVSRLHPELDLQPLRIPSPDGCEGDVPPADPPG